MRQFYKRKTGVPTGYMHYWDYPNGKWMEKKVMPGLWRFEYTSSKHRHGRQAKYHPNAPGPGSRVHWIIHAHQYAVKTSPNSYQTKMTGWKRLAKMTHKPWNR